MKKEKDTEKDSFDPIHTMIATVCFLPFFLNPFFPESDWIFTLIFFLYMLVIPIVFCVFLASIIYYSWHRKWRRVASVILAPLPIICLTALAYKSPIPEWIYLQFHKSDYLAQIANHPRSKNELLTKTFPVGVWGMAVGASGSYTIVYDETDNMRVHSKTHPCDNVKNLGDHFYFVNSVEGGCKWDS